MLLGIDPGIKNLGLAVITHDSELVLSRNLNLAEFGSMTDFIDGVICILCDTIEDTVTHACLERFVSYGNVQSKSTERITMLIGGLVYALNSLEIPTGLYRAIDWKPALCKHLVKNNEFDNPSLKLDKKFSYAAAKSIIKDDAKTDHEADAICLAYMWNVDKGESAGMVD